MSEEQYEIAKAEGKMPTQADFFTAIERLAVNPDVDVAKIQQILDMQEQVLNRNARQAFNAAMMRAQSRIELIAENRTNQQTHSDYADLTAILLKAKPIYTSEGFSLMFYEGETSKENHKRVYVDIMHEQGHTETRYVDLAIQTTGIAGKAMMTQIHGEGSAFSYGRRYLTCMIFNIPTGDDDDGNRAGSEPAYITDKQLSTITDMINAKNVNESKFLTFMGCESLEKIPADQYAQAMTALRAARGEKNGNHN